MGCGAKENERKGGKERKEGIKDGEVERWRGKCVLAPVSIYMFHKD